MFSDQNAKRHSETRRKIASAYSMSSLLKMEGFVDNCSEVLTEKFTGFAAKGEVINLGHWMQCYAFDVRPLMARHIRCADFDFSSNR